MCKRKKIIKFFSCFGKFQPGLFLVKEVSESEINTLDSEYPDILKLFNSIDEKFKEILFLNSGKVRFSIRGDYYIKNDREIFIQATALTALNLQIGVCYSLLLALYTRMFDCDCGFSSFREKIKLDSIVLER